MTRRPKIAHFALTASLLGGAVIAPVVLSGEASAQSGARICGRMWQKKVTLEDRTVVTVERIFKLYEVNKGLTYFACKSARDGGGSAKDPSEGPDILTKNLLKTNTYWEEQELEEMLICEYFTANFLPNLEFKEVEGGPKFSDKTDTTDICNNMNRSENLTQMKGYWSLYNLNTKNTWFIHG